jgi:hypothetical protein
LTGYPRTHPKARGSYPAHRSLFQTQYAGARVFSRRLLDQLPNTRVFNAIRLGECLLSTLDL